MRIEAGHEFVIRYIAILPSKRELVKLPIFLNEYRTEDCRRNGNISTNVAKHLDDRQCGSLLKMYRDCGGIYKFYPYRKFLTTSMNLVAGKNESELWVHCLS